MLERTTDGFALAEDDLRLRGPGDFFGTRQSGLPELKVATMADTQLLVEARVEAEGSGSATPTCARWSMRRCASVSSSSGATSPRIKAISGWLLSFAPDLTPGPSPTRRGECIRAVRRAGRRALPS